MFAAMTMVTGGDALMQRILYSLLKGFQAEYSKLRFSQFLIFLYGNSERGFLILHFAGKISNVFGLLSFCGGH